MRLRSLDVLLPLAVRERLLLTTKPTATWLDVRINA
jgi:hypothetical protein